MSAPAIAGLEPALRELEQRLGPREGAPVTLDGGLTNRNVRVRLGGRRARAALLRPETPKRSASTVRPS